MELGDYEEVCLTHVLPIIFFSHELSNFSAVSDFFSPPYDNQSIYVHYLGRNKPVLPTGRRPAFAYWTQAIPTHLHKRTSLRTAHAAQAFPCKPCFSSFYLGHSLGCYLNESGSLGCNLLLQANAYENKQTKNLNHLYQCN